MKKYIIFLKANWWKLLLGFLFLAAFSLMTIFLQSAFRNFGQMESFSRRQILGSMGFYLLISIFTAFIQMPLMFLMYWFFLQGGGLGNLKMEKANRANVQVKWDEVIGMEDAKREAMELVKLLKDRSLLKVIGGKIIKGTIMFGPPGCGKTYLAKAIASECGMPMLSVSGSEFMGMIIGQGVARMKTLFSQARLLAEQEGGCLIFIDEIDSFARPRMADHGLGGVPSHNATINQFLTELDGMRKAENNLVVIAATNVQETDLDPAIMRAGRFDRKIYVTLPNLEERKKLFEFYLGRVETDGPIDTAMLSRKCLYFSPSDIDNMVREAGLIALRRQTNKISIKDLNEAYDRVSFGLKSNIVMSPEEKLWTAYHEAGHAVIAYLLHPINDVIKASIVPHKGMLGFVSHRSAVEQHGKTKETLLADIKVALASYVAERMKFGSSSSGVGGSSSADFAHAMYTARLMVMSYGMGPSGLVGDFSTMDWRHLSEATKSRLDSDVQEILQQCMIDVEKTLAQYKDAFETFAQTLHQKEDLEYDEIVGIFDKFGIKPPRTART
jgi:ATP-dependent metalloprotease FtsH